MTRSTILYELFNLTIPAGTGIATYARNLCAIGAELGYDVEGLLHSYRSIDAKDPTLAEVSFFDARNRKISPFTKYVTMNMRRGVGVPFGIKSRPMARGGIVVHPNADRTLAALKTLHVSRLFMDLSRAHFKRFGSAARLRMETTPDVFHATQAVPLYVPGAKNVYTIHDIIPLRLPYSTLDDKKYFLNMTRKLGQIADKIVTVSEASRDDLIRYCGIPPEKIVNTYQSVTFPSEILSQSNEEAARLVKHSFGLDVGDYYLFYGAIEPKKNVGRLIDAFIASGTTRKLALAGGLGWEYEGDLEKIKDNTTHALKVEGRRIMPDERIRRLQHLPLFQLAALIRCSRAVIFPSLYEGFGLPVLESMLLRSPVITSNVSSLVEVAGDAALLVEPTEIQSIMAAIQKIDSDDALCSELSARGVTQAKKFSPGAHKERLGRVYEDLLHR